MASKVSYGQKGAIVKIRLRNFMTYIDCTLRPAGNLNMIIGPNGSGKSAIVCAIIVGLAGEVSLTGRATNIISLVRRGSDWASTKIELWSGKQSRKNDIIERKIVIQRSENKVGVRNEWRHNGQPVNVKYIQDLMQSLNIKVDNLCQFLPQDSVASFVKMSPSELLVNTLEAAGDNQLVKDLSELKRYTKDINEQSRHLEELKKSSEENAVNARRLETEVERLRIREKLAQEKLICTKKIEYCRYLEAQESLAKAEQDLRDKKELLKEMKKAGEPYRKDIETNKSESTRLNESIRAYNQEYTKVIGKMQSQIDKVNTRDTDVKENYAAFRHKEDQEKTRAQQIRDKQRELEGYECRLNEIRDVDYTREIERLTRLADDKKKELLQKNSDKSAIENVLRNLVREIEQVRQDRDKILGVKDKKINIIMTKQPGTHKVVEWLSKNREKFKKDVYLPMFCEINVKDARDSAVIEHAIPSADLFAFVCEDEDDLKLLTRTARLELKANINVILRPEKTIDSFENEASSQSNYPPKLDFRLLKDLIDAPESILRYLYGQYGFHQTPVYKDLPESDLKTVMNKCKRFYVGNKFYHISRSRYDNEIMTVTDTVRAANLLIHSLDNKQLRKCSDTLERCLSRKRECEQEQKQIHQDYDEINKEWSEMAKRINQLQMKQSEKRRLEQLAKKCQDNIKDLSVDTIDIDEERRKLQKSVVDMNQLLIQDLKVLSDMIARLDKSIVPDICSTVLLHRMAQRNIKIFEKMYKEAVSRLSQYEKDIENVSNSIISLKKGVRDAETNATDKIQGFHNGILDKDTKRSFAGISQNTVAELETHIEELKFRIHGICRDPNNQLMNDYNRQNAELRDKQRQMSELSTSLDMFKSCRQEIKDSFLPKLSDLIRVIDEHYRDFMRKLNYDGKVELKFNEVDGDDFTDYGINIMVKYRDNEDLIALSSTRQSGGERSVATMIYMLALQTQTTVPFRVVDEINQGMDQENERKVFELLVRTADESSSQYFLVSPKLLSGLNYGDKMQIHAVFNGPALNYSFDDLLNSDLRYSQGD